MKTKKVADSFITIPKGNQAKIAIFSDSHGNELAFQQAIFSAAKSHSIHAALHLGDCAPDSSLLNELMPQWPCFVVRGNNDYNCRNYPSELILRMGDQSIYACHGHQYSASDRTQRLVYRAQELGATMICYGHTHVPNIERIEDILIVNPGSVSYPRNASKPGYAIATLNDKHCHAEIMPLPRFF